MTAERIAAFLIVASGAGKISHSKDGNQLSHGDSLKRTSVNVTNFRVRSVALVVSSAGVDLAMSASSKRPCQWGWASSCCSMSVFTKNSDGVDSVGAVFLLGVVGASTLYKRRIGLNGFAVGGTRGCVSQVEATGVVSWRRHVPVTVEKDHPDDTAS